MEKLIVLVLVLFVLGYAFAPLFKKELYANTLRVFIVLYVTLFGLAMIFGSVRNDEGIPMGDLFASLGLTFFWSMRKKADSTATASFPVGAGIADAGITATASAAPSR